MQLTTVTSVTDTSSVKFDTIPPTLASVNIASINPTNTLASPEIEIVLTLVADEEIQQPVVTFQSGGNSIANQGSGITYDTADGGITWTATYKGHENDSEGGSASLLPSRIF